MKVIVFYNSKFGNGKTMSEYMVKSFVKKNHKAKAFSMQEVQPKKLEQADLYIFSSSTHIGNAPFKTRGFLKKIRKQNKANFALVTTNLAPQKSKTIKTMREILAKRGYVEAKDPLILKVDSMKGPLEKDYQEKVDLFIDDVGLG